MRIARLNKKHSNMKTRTVRFTVRQCALLATIGVFFLAGCTTTTTSMRPTHYPFSAKGWNSIDSVEFLQEFQLGSYTRLVVEPLDTSAAVLPPKDDNTYEPTVTVLKQTDGIVLAELAQKLKGKLEVSGQEPDTNSLEKTLLLRGKVAEIHPGSQAARYWGGFGAGSAWVKINGEIVDAKTQNVLLRFEQRRVSAVGLFGGAYKPMLTDCIVEIGRDIGRLLISCQTQ
jgi:hypothetical protein